MFFLAKAMKLIKEQAAPKKHRHVRTCCLDCKEPMERLIEFFCLRIRQRFYRCPVCRKTLWRYYDLSTARYYPNFIAAINGQIEAELTAEHKAAEHA